MKNVNEKATSHNLKVHKTMRRKDEKNWQITRQNKLRLP